jgi:hypothetical protein
MPFDHSKQPRTYSQPWSSELVHLSDDDRPFQKGSAEHLGVDEGVYKFGDDGKLQPYFVNGDFAPTYPPGGTLGVSDYDKPDPAFLETVSAWFRQGNMITSGFVSRANTIPDDDFFKVETGYDVYDDIKGYETYADKFEQVYNRNAAQAVKADIDQELKDRETLAASGWINWGAGLAGATLLDPTILIPGGAVVKAGRVGYSVGKTAANVAAHAGAATAIQEVGLHSSQQLRTAQDSFLAIGGSVILGGIIGTAGARRLDAIPPDD